MPESANPHCDEMVGQQRVGSDGDQGSLFRTPRVRPKAVALAHGGPRWRVFNVQSRRWRRSENPEVGRGRGRA
jgi:hypothetical protein